MPIITFFCPNLKCKAMLQADEAQRGQKVRCKQCGQVIVVPVKSTPKK
jgi:DNA-directed RNA polymerase subunit RPC12/RpoP